MNYSAHRFQFRVRGKDIPTEGGGKDSRPVPEDIPEPEDGVFA